MLGDTPLRNDGNATFTRMTSAQIGELADDAGDTAMGLWADMDNDGDLDIYIANYSEATRVPEWDDPATPAQEDRLYLNDGNGRFMRTTMPGLSEIRTYSNGANLVDYDGDGLLDIFVLTVLIEWPSGTVQELTNVAADQILTVVEPPRLAAESDGTLSWPVTADGYRLESATAVDGSWSEALETVETNGSRKRVTIQPDAESKFYRLNAQ